MVGRITGTALISLLGLGWTAAAACADVFFLSNGGRIEGTLTNPDESPRKSYVVETHFGGRLTLAGDQVERVVVKSDLERRYEAYLASVPDTAEGHRDVAERCRQAKLDKHREYHLEQVLRHAPDHEGARHALGYTRVDGRWRRHDDWMEKQGYVRHRGAWHLPQELALERLAEEEEEKTVEWRKKLKTWATWIVKGRGRGGEGQAAIRAIRDPYAAPALADLLSDDKKPGQLRLLYVDVLAELGPNAATQTFTRHALLDRDAAIRDRCLDHLVKWKSRHAVAAFSRELSDDENLMVRRAATALARMKDPAATLPLIEALITEHKQKIGGGGMNTTFSNQGGGGISMGGRPKIVLRPVRNEPVLTALTVLCPGVNFGYDEGQWRKWHVEQVTPKNVNLRRSQ